jgi:misacylated tRNA(Ala) deacylase
MTTPLFRDDPYLTTAEATVTASDEATVTLDRSVFYPAGGGQPGDTGRLELDDGTTVAVTDARYADDRSTIRLAVAAPVPVGNSVVQHLEWPRRYRLMRMHTALHLLSVALPFPVTGGQIGESESRLDFDIPEPNLDKDEIAEKLAELIAADHPVSQEWITDEELDANPELVKTMAVTPPRGSGTVRLVRIGTVDLQPCGGTHVASTAEIGGVTVNKIEKKGRQNRRVRLGLVD